VPQPVLRTARLLLVPLADRHLDLEIQLDSDPEVLRYLGGRARWMAFGSGGGTRGSAPPASEEEGEFAGLMMLPPAHGPDQPDDPAVSDLGYRLVRRYWRQGLASESSHALLRHVRTFPSSEEPFPGTELGEVEYEMTRDMWQRLRELQGAAT
jgi:RimJ/RimL family protein N-acetyltransferase